MVSCHSVLAQFASSRGEKAKARAELRKAVEVAAMLGGAAAAAAAAGVEAAQKAVDGAESGAGA